MELAALVVEGLSTLAHSLLAGTEAAEVLGRLGDDVAEELEDDASRSSTANSDVKEDLRASHFGRFLLFGADESRIGSGLI